MIKRITVMTRKPGTTHQQFADYWTNVHAPLLASHPAVKRLVLNVTEQFVRFSVRNEHKDDPLRDTILTQTPDGFVELWFADTESMEEMYHSEHTKKLVADAENFVGAIATFVVEERVIK
ncbi:MAG: EthD family reductase [Alphaproteobacteria bacterium]|nr:EthD family reductase [Alphaproteobacteria bacterium]